MKIKIVKCLKDNYAYIIFNEITLASAVVDPSEANPIINEIEKNNLKLKYILNTHHHYDHVGGNKKLKEKYNCKVVGFEKDKSRIPEIDITLKDNQKWENDLFECSILHIPGHTSGHICIYINEINALFTGDTLFSLGCGRIFEGTYKQMFSSLKLIKSFPKKTKIYCGHEYTLKNSDFCLKYDSKNFALKKKNLSVKNYLNKGLTSMPTTLEDELSCNIFLKSEDIETFSKLRDLKDNF